MIQYRVDGQIAVVTGAGQGIGKQCAMALAEYGAHVVLTDMPTNMNSLEETRREILKLNPDAKVLCLPLDICDLAQIDAAVTAVEERFGGCDILVNNVGVNILADSFQLEEEHWDYVVDTNLKGTFFCSQRFGRTMRLRGGGKIICLSSQFGVVGYYYRAAYCASKGGLGNLVRALAVEWAEYDIRVNAVAPTLVETERSRDVLHQQENIDEYIPRVPLSRYASLDDVAGLVLFLASPAANMITGQTYLIDGGWTAI